jgi:tungstate transport system ATP-binding protein
MRRRIWSRRRRSGAWADVASSDSILPLVLDEVSYVAGGRSIIDGVSLTLERDLRTVILGANGAGKSVLMRLCHGLLQPARGRIVWANADPERVRARQAMVFQRPVMLRRSSLANIEYALWAAGCPAAQRTREARAALALVGLETLDASPARRLSGGEQQRLALARAYALRPQVLFLDEPTANLDPGAAAEVERIIGSIHAGGTKIVMSTHNLGQARRLADEIVFLHQGRLVERTSVEAFFAEPRSLEARAFLNEELPWK